MNNDILLHMMVHIDLLDLVERCSKGMLRAASEGNLEEVGFLSENRERVIAVLTAKQQEIESFTHLIEVRHLTPQLMAIIKSWGQDLDHWVMRIQELDNQIVNQLEREKAETSKQIGTLFKTKEQFKGYNLNNTKK